MVGAAVGVTCLLFVCQGFLAVSIHNARSDDCHRTDAIVLGIYSIIDRGLARQQSAYHHHVITKAQLKTALTERDRIHRDITRPHC